MGNCLFLSSSSFPDLLLVLLLFPLLWPHLRFLLPLRPSSLPLGGGLPRRRRRLTRRRLTRRRLTLRRRLVRLSLRHGRPRRVPPWLHGRRPSSPVAPGVCYATAGTHAVYGLPRQASINCRIFSVLFPPKNMLYIDKPTCRGSLPSLCRLLPRRPGETPAAAAGCRAQRAGRPDLRVHLRVPRVHPLDEIQVRLRLRRVVPVSIQQPKNHLARQGKKCLHYQSSNYYLL